MILREPKHSVNSHTDDDFEPEWVSEAFTTMLVCDNSVCGEIVAVSGRAGVEFLADYDQDGGANGEWATVLYPASMYPAPPLFPISSKLPEPVKSELKLAFQLFWADRSASTSRLRTSLERLLDDRGIATTALDKHNKSYRLTLAARIDLFEKANNDPDNAESMNALRVVGNLGTHGDQVNLGDYFDLLDVYEDALLEIYEQTSAVLKAKKAALIALKPA